MKVQSSLSIGRVKLQIKYKEKYSKLPKPKLFFKYFTSLCLFLKLFSKVLHHQGAPCMVIWRICIKHECVKRGVKCRQSITSWVHPAVWVSTQHPVHGNKQVPRRKPRNALPQAQPTPPSAALMSVCLSFLLSFHSSCDSIDSITLRIQG